jgi:hypothetical protein
MSRMPPNYRRPDTCEGCEFFSGVAVCILYDYDTPTPDRFVCDDFRPFEEE